MSGFIVILLLFGGMIFGLVVMEPESRKTVFFWMFDSRTSNLQLNLYFGFLALFSIFLYTAFAAMVIGIPLDIAGLGKGVGIIFGGMGVGSFGAGVQTKDDSDDDDDDPTDKMTPASIQSTFFLKLFNSKDRSVETHLFFGALVMICIIFYQGYDLAYMSKHWDPEEYGYAFAYTFAGIAAAGLGQNAQRKIESSKAKRKRKRKVPPHV